MHKPSVLMVVENSYPKDTRVRREANTLKDQYDITVICIRGRSEKFHEWVEGIEVYRVPELKLRATLKISNHAQNLLEKSEYIFQYLFFTFAALIIFLMTHWNKKYQIIHAHNPPDTLCVIGLVGRLLGSKFVYDHHDLSPELYLTKFGKGNDLIHKALIFFERMSCKLAHAVIATNSSYRDVDISRHVIDPGRVFIVRNDPIIHKAQEYQQANEAQFAEASSSKKTILFLGSINPQDGVDLLLRSLHYLVYEIKETNFVALIVGDGDSFHAMTQLCGELMLQEYVHFTGYVTDRNAVRRFLHSADVCVEPAPDNPLNCKSTFIKVMEYMAARKPLVAYDLPETRYSANGSAILISSPDPRKFAEAIKELLDQPELRERLGKAGYMRIESELNWNASSENLLNAYRHLF